MSFLIRLPLYFALLASLLLGSVAVSQADSPDSESSDVAEALEEGSDKEKQKVPSEIAKTSGDSSDDDEAEEEKPKYPPAAKVLKDTKEIDGLLTLHFSDQKLYAELGSGDMGKDYIVLITIARGIGQTPILGGFSWGFGNDWVWQFRKVGENIQVVRRNVRFRAKEGTPTAEAVKLAYTDSVMFSLPIASKTSGGAYLIDLTPVFLSDLPQISQVLPGFSLSKQRSTFLEPKGYAKNVEIQVAATYASSGRMDIDSVADSRAATINVHYSLSRLPKTDYTPRKADDRVGYFLTAIKDFSKKGDDDRFVRYINRWNLQKVDPKAETSTPKEPIKFWLEKTIPFKYRKPIRDGIEEWNKAFELAGYYDAIDVEQQPNDADWDPGDINYNTFRWITSDAGFAMGPSRVNPLTGEILDADIIFDANFLTYWKREYEVFTPKGVEAFTGGPIELNSYQKQQDDLPMHLQHGHTGRCSCNLLSGASQQLAFGAAMTAARKRSPKELEKLYTQALKEVTMHEVGHTLGLRHNFKASTLHSLEDLQDPEKVAEQGITASVMDYTPVVIMPEGKKQTDFYSTTIGPYDYWAIEYGYKPLDDEKKGLKEIASRSGEPGLAFSTDEDTRGIDPDPHSKRFDLTDDLVGYARLQSELVNEAMPNLVKDMVEEGDGYQKARQAFGLLLIREGTAMFNAARYVGGIYVSRSHKGDENAPEPFEIVDVDKQREALLLLEEEIFSANPFNVPEGIYNKLVPTKWNHWGTRVASRPDYPIHKTILAWQDRILSQVMSNLTLERLHDSELKVPADQDALTTAELLGRLTDIIFAEVGDFEAGDYTNRKPAITSLRRNLQRSYLERLSKLALDRTNAPKDCQTIAYAELVDLKAEIDELLNADPKLDRYSEAHLRELTARIGKLLETDLILDEPGFSLFF